MKKYIVLFLKGIGIGAANVIPGVSGGTIALITGIFEKLINSLKSIDITAFRLLIKGEFRKFSKHVNLDFLLLVFGGVFVSILTFARLFEFLFLDYPVFVWSYFFGLILASVYFVGKTVHKYTLPVILTFLIGVSLALIITFLSPGSENDNIWYLFLCGIVAVCSMILPGLSGSFVLILMGNYELVFIEAVNNMDMTILLPVVIGAIFGLIAFSHALSWILRKYKDQTISLLTGFILGSLLTLWPWKRVVYQLDSMGEIVVKTDGTQVIQAYERFFPQSFNTEVILALVLMLAGFLTITLLEKIAVKEHR